MKIFQRVLWSSCTSLLPICQRQNICHLTKHLKTLSLVNSVQQNCMLQKCARTFHLRASTRECCIPLLLKQGKQDSFINLPQFTRGQHLPASRLTSQIRNYSENAPTNKTVISGKSTKAKRRNTAKVAKKEQANLVKSTPLGKKTTRKKDKSTAGKEDCKKIWAYAPAEKLNLDSMRQYITKDENYYITNLPSDMDDVLHITPIHTGSITEDAHLRNIFFFSKGSVVFWDVPTIEKDELLRKMLDHCIDKYSSEIVEEGLEGMDFKVVKEHSTLIQDTIHLQENLDSKEAQLLDMYAFSDALSRSVKIGIYELMLEEVLVICEKVSKNMKLGTEVRFEKNKNLRNLGKLFALRDSVNLSSDFLDTPDFYWDRGQKLENLYIKCYRNQSIAKRIDNMNLRLDKAIEILEFVKNLKSDQHHVRLEYYIIILIALEVIIELYERVPIPELESAFNTENPQQLERLEKICMTTSGF